MVRRIRASYLARENVPKNRLRRVNAIAAEGRKQTRNNLLQLAATSIASSHIHPGISNNDQS